MQKTPPTYICPLRHILLQKGQFIHKSWIVTFVLRLKWKTTPCYSPSLCSKPTWLRNIDSTATSFRETDVLIWRPQGTASGDSGHQGHSGLFYFQSILVESKPLPVFQSVRNFATGQIVQCSWFILKRNTICSPSLHLCLPVVSKRLADFFISLCWLFLKKNPKFFNPPSCGGVNAEILHAFGQFLNLFGWVSCWGSWTQITPKACSGNKGNVVCSVMDVEQPLGYTSWPLGKMLLMRPSFSKNESEMSLGPRVARLFVPQKQQVCLATCHQKMAQEEKWQWNLEIGWQHFRGTTLCCCKCNPWEKQPCQNQMLFFPFSVGFLVFQHFGFSVFLCLHSISFFKSQSMPLSCNIRDPHPFNVHLKTNWTDSVVDVAKICEIIKLEEQKAEILFLFIVARWTDLGSFFFFKISLQPALFQLSFLGKQETNPNLLISPVAESFGTCVEATCPLEIPPKPKCLQCVTICQFFYLPIISAGDTMQLDKGHTCPVMQSQLETWKTEISLKHMRQ